MTVAMSALISRVVLFACFMFADSVPAFAQAQDQEITQQAHAIGVVMYAYANDHNGAYPTGSSSTEVFQKLIDGGYVNNPILFFVPMPGKVKPTSNKLKPENVSFDVTNGVDIKTSSDAVPLLFLTGFLITYAPGSTAEPTTEDAQKRDGMVIFYHSGSTQFLKKDVDRIIHNAVPKFYDDKVHHYQQLTPEGPPGLT
jgi:hypothetical protein